MSSHKQINWTRILKYFKEPDLFSNLSLPPPLLHPHCGPQHGVEETAAKCRKLGAVVQVFVVDCSNRAEIYKSVDQVRTGMHVSTYNPPHQLILSGEMKRLSLSRAAWLPVDISCSVKLL